MADTVNTNQNNEFYTPGAFILEEASITNFDNSIKIPLDLNHFSEISIVEDIYTSNIRGYIDIIDKECWIERLPIIGEEYMLLRFRVPNRGKDCSIVLNKLRVYKITDRVASGVRMGKVETYRLHFISQETISSFNQSVSRSFSEQTVDSIVKSVWNDYVTPISEEEAGKKKCVIESTSGKVNFIAPNWTPFKVINWLAENMAIDSKGNADFVFYEATDKSKGSSYNFKSLESLMQQDPTYTLMFSPQNLSIPGREGYRNKSTSQFNVEEIIYDTNSNVLDNTLSGQYYQYWIFHDILRKKFVVSKFSHEEDYLKQHGESKNGKHKFYGNRVKSEAKPLQFMRMPGNVNTFPKKVSKTKAINNDTASTAEAATGRKTVDYISKRESTRNLETSDMNSQVSYAREFKFQQMKNYELFLDNIPGTDEIQLGKMIKLVKPHVTHDPELFSKQIGSEEDRYLSGNYLVTRIEHVLRFDGDQAAWRYRIAINAARDYLNNKVEFKDLKSE